MAFAHGLPAPLQRSAALTIEDAFVAAMGISALLYRHYEFRCTHLRERVTPWQ